MTDQELLQARMQKWRLDGQTVHTLDDARAFLESVGFCLMYPMRPAVFVAAFIGAWGGGGKKLPTRPNPHKHSRAKKKNQPIGRAPPRQRAYEGSPVCENNA